MATYTKISDIAKVTSLSAEDLLLIETAGGTKSIRYADALATLIPQTAAAHNAIFRGKNLNNVYTITQICEMINSGKFADLFIGDYFDVTINTTFTENETVRCVLAGFDMYLKNGDTSLVKHHAVVVPKNCFTATAKMNSTNTTGVSANPDNPVGSVKQTSADLQKAAYEGSDMNQLVLPIYATALQTALQNHLLSFKDLLTHKQSAQGVSMAGANFTGYSSGWEWVSIQLRLMSEVQLYGSTVFSSSFYDIGAANLQLPLFRLDPTAKVCGLGGTGDGGRQWYWLSAVASATNFAICDGNGHSGNDDASNSYGVRPLFLIG